MGKLRFHPVTGCSYSYLHTSKGGACLCVSLGTLLLLTSAAIPPELVELYKLQYADTTSVCFVLLWFYF